MYQGERVRDWDPFTSVDEILRQAELSCLKWQLCRNLRFGILILHEPLLNHHPMEEAVQLSINFPILLIAKDLASSTFLARRAICRVESFRLTIDYHIDLSARIFGKRDTGEILVALLRKVLYALLRIVKCSLFPIHGKQDLFHRTPSQLLRECLRRKRTISADASGPWGLVKEPLELPPDQAWPALWMIHSSKRT